MERRTRPYCLYRRSLTKGRPVYYAKIFDPNTGELLRRVSTGEIADRSLAALPLWQLGSLQQVVEANHAVRHQELRQQTLGVLPLPGSGHRAEDDRYHDRNVLLLLSLAMLAWNVSVDSSPMDRPAEATRNRAAFDVELMNKIG